MVVHVGIDRVLGIEGLAINKRMGSILIGPNPISSPASPFLQSDREV